MFFFLLLLLMPFLSNNVRKIPILESVNVFKMSLSYFVNWKKHTITSGEKVPLVRIQFSSHQKESKWSLFGHSCTLLSMDPDHLMTFSHLFSRDFSLDIYHFSPQYQTESVHNTLLMGRRNQGSGKDLAPSACIAVCFCTIDP